MWNVAVSCPPGQSTEHLRKKGARPSMRSIFFGCDSLLSLSPRSYDLLLLTTRYDYYYCFEFLQVRMERQSYWSRRRMAVKYPKQFMSMIIDGRPSFPEWLSLLLSFLAATVFFFYFFFFFVCQWVGADQQANGVPRWYQKTYALQGAWRMPVHVYGKPFI